MSRRLARKYGAGLTSYLVLFNIDVNEAAFTTDSMLPSGAV